MDERQTAQIMADLQVASCCWPYSVLVDHNVTIVLLRFQSSETELEIYDREIRRTYRSLAYHLDPLPTREEHAGVKKMTYGAGRFRRKPPPFDPNSRAW